MGRDVRIFNFDGHTPPPLAATPAFRPPSMGSAAKVREAISSALADVDWSDPTRGVLSDEGWTLEFDLGADALVHGFTIHVRGGGGVMGLVAHLCLVNGWAALDCARGVFFDLEELAREDEASGRDPSLN